MFEKLGDLSFKRSTIQAVGFYVVTLILTMLFGVVVAGLLGILTGNNDDFDFGVRVGSGVAILVSLGLAGAILYKKNLINNILYLLFVVLAGILALLGGGLLGLIPAAYLTTRKRASGA